MTTAHRKYKHTSSLHKDRVTIVMIASEDYSSFPKAVDRLYEHTDYPFDLLVIEGQAPHPIQLALEKRAKKLKNMRILYTHHTPILSDAYNIAMVHVRTPLAFFTDNRILPAKGWLSDIVRALRLYNADILCPTVTDESGRAVASMTGLSFLATRHALTKLGEFDDKVHGYYFALDLSLAARAKELDIRNDDETQVRRDFSLPAKAYDKKLFEHQWNARMAGNAAAYMGQKWGVELDPLEGSRWLVDRLRGSGDAFWGAVRGSLGYLNSGLNYAKLGLTRLMHSLIQI